jgi:hypothetical protein
MDAPPYASYDKASTIVRFSSISKEVCVRRIRMNYADTFERNWNQLRAKIRPTWQALTDSDVAMIGGKLDTLTELLREKYSYSELQANGQVENFIEEHTAATNPA